MPSNLEPPKQVLRPKAPVNTLGLWGKIKLALSLKRIYDQAESNIMKNMSWKTTLGGVIMALVPVITPLLPDNWTWVHDAMLSIGALVLGATARDNDKSSEDVGTK